MLWNRIQANLVDRQHRVHQAELASQRRKALNIVSRLKNR